MDNSINERASVGGNNPPEPIDEEFEALQARVNELAAVGQRYRDERPKLEDKEQAGRATEFIKHATAATRAIEDLRTARKRPIIEAGREIDAKFKSLLGTVAIFKKEVETKLTEYNREQARRAQELRQRQIEEARKKEEEAAKVAASASSVQEVERAARAVEDAETHRKAAEAITAAPVRSDGGNAAVTRTTWAFEITDLAAVDLAALRPYLPMDAVEKAVRAWLKTAPKPGKGPAPALAGVHIFIEEKTVVR